MAGSERMRELRRRRHRKKKLAYFKRKIETTRNPQEVEVYKDKIRRLTPGADVIFSNWGIADEN